MNYSPEYADIQRQFHDARPDYGVSGMKYADQVMGLAERMKTRSILDYGCGKGTLQKAIPFPIQNYDPFVPEFWHLPQAADIVVCTDVMEHVEPDYITQTLGDIATLTKGLTFFQIATRPAAKFLPDGRNAHLIQEGVNWWLDRLMKFFDIRQLQDMSHGFIVIGTPFRAVDPE